MHTFPSISLIAKCASSSLEKTSMMNSEAKKSVSSRPTSSQGRRPSSAHSSRSENIGLGQLGHAMVTDVGVKLRPKVNPFGDAKPREVVLQEKGKDWRKIHLELERRAIDRCVIVSLFLQFSYLLNTYYAGMLTTA